MATETAFESDAVSKSRSESAEGMEGLAFQQTHPSSGTGTMEYRANKLHCTTTTDTVSDQARFSRRLGDESLITDGMRIFSGLSVAKGVWQGEVKGRGRVLMIECSFVSSFIIIYSTASSPRMARMYHRVRC